MKWEEEYLKGKLESTEKGGVATAKIVYEYPDEWLEGQKPCFGIPPEDEFKNIIEYEFFWTFMKAKKGCFFDLQTVRFFAQSIRDRDEKMLDDMAIMFDRMADLTEK